MAERSCGQGRNGHPSLPYTDEEEARIIELLTPKKRTPAEVMDGLCNALLLWRVPAELRPLFITVKTRPGSQEAKRLLRRIKASCDKLSGLLAPLRLLTDPELESMTDEENLATFALFRRPRLKEGEFELGPAVLTVEDLERALRLLDDLAWLSERITAAKSEGKAGAPKQSMSSLIWYLVSIWIQEHGRSPGDWEWHKNRGPILDFVQVCAGPILSPEESQRVESVLHEVMNERLDLGLDPSVKKGPRGGKRGTD